jgi:hypothetical protein
MRLLLNSLFLYHHCHLGYCKQYFPESRQLHHDLHHQMLPNYRWDLRLGILVKDLLGVRFQLQLNKKIDDHRQLHFHHL